MNTYWFINRNYNLLENLIEMFITSTGHISINKQLILQKQMTEWS